MTNQGKVIFLVVFVLTSLVIQYDFSFSEIQLKDVISTVVGGVIAVLIITLFQKLKNK